MIYAVLQCFGDICPYCSEPVNKIHAGLCEQMNQMLTLTEFIRFPHRQTLLKRVLNYVLMSNV